MGSHLVQGLLATSQHTVTAITRHNSASEMPKGVNVVTVDYEDENSLISALKGQHAFIISLPFYAGPETQAKLIAAAGKAGVPYIIPNSFGVNFDDEKLATEAKAGLGIRQAITNIQELAPKATWVAFVCGFWYEYSISLGSNFYGFDLENKKATFYDDGNTMINTSTWDQCRRAIGAFLSLPELPEDENDTQPTISQWANKGLYISSFLISQRDMLASLQRTTSTTEKDWTIEYEPSKERWESGLELMKTEPVTGFSKALYARVLFPNGGGKFEQYGLANEALGLPKESLDEATKRGLKLAGEEYNPFSRQSVRD